jgi:hypothetical protein
MKLTLRAFLKTAELDTFWFSGSKVVDSKGKPLKLYHVTSHDFGTFDTKMGAHFGTLSQVDEHADRLDFRGEEGIRYIPVYLNIKNPQRVKDLGPDPQD